MRSMIRIVHVVVMAMLCLAAAVVYANDYPARTIRVLVPYPPGGGADNVSRLIMPKLAAVFGQQVVIDNRPGASGIIAAEFVAKSPADGYTLLHDATAHSVNPALRKLPYDTLKDFTPITLLVVNPNFLVVHPSFAIRTVSDLIELAKARPAQITYASSGIGSAQHMAGALFEYMTKTRLVHVPYKGGGAVYSDLIGGQVQMFFANIASGLVHVKSGKLRGIAVTSAKRSASAPEYPTFAESGMPGYEVYEWNGLFGPAGMPKEIVARLNTEIVKILNMPEVKERFFQLGAEAAPSSPEQLGNYVRNEVGKWESVVRALNIKAD
jgi:tripartite-type tricarboxylate transporter receptor subunit TctC